MKVTWPLTLSGEFEAIRMDVLLFLWSKQQQRQVRCGWCHFSVTIFADRGWAGVGKWGDLFPPVCGMSPWNQPSTRCSMRENGVWPHVCASSWLHGLTVVFLHRLFQPLSVISNKDGSVPHALAEPSGGSEKVHFLHRTVWCLFQHGCPPLTSHRGAELCRACFPPPTRVSSIHRKRRLFRTNRNYIKGIPPFHGVSSSKVLLETKTLNMDSLFFMKNGLF